MNGFINKTVLAASCAGLMGSLVGCTMTCKDLYDPCYPQRYEAQSREAVGAAITPQAQNGHVLDQTVWNYHFESGADHLTPAGMEHLAYLARRRPQADTVVYIQTAQDIIYDPAAPDKFASARYDLDSRRIQAVQKYLNAQTMGRHQEFQVLVHDPSEVGLSAIAASNSIGKSNSAFQGTLPLGGASASTGGAGGSQGGGQGGGSGSQSGGQSSGGAR